MAADRCSGLLRAVDLALALERDDHLSQQVLPSEVSVERLL